MKSGSIVLAALPQSDRLWKLRPILLVKNLPGFGDWLVAGISTQIQYAIPDWDVLINPLLPEFTMCGIKQMSIVRLSFLAVVPENSISGSLGTLPETLVRELKKRLSDYVIQ